jgi:DNA-binding MarR family transcriptional regulator
VTEKARNLSLDAQLCFQLYNASRSLIRAYGPLLDPLGLTYPQYIAMLALWDSSGPMPVGALSTRLSLDTGTLTPLLKRLEQAGLIERRRDEADERRVVITLTPAGGALREKAADVPARLQERLQLDVDAARALHAELTDLTAAIKRAAAETKR